MNEKPIERLNYFNGQRLQAADLKLEQDYHVRVRRWLNRSLYTSGIADGLIVKKVPLFPMVRIGPGLALDSMGREIILIDEHEETVPGAHDDKNLPLALYLTIRYGEEVLARQDACCTPVNGSQNKVAWGGPSRVLAEPVFEWSRDLPHESSGKVLLAYVALGKGCKDVNVLDTSVRRYVGAASAAKVKQYALEGEREVAAIPTADPEKPIRVTAQITFHVRGRQPNSVTLYLKAREFSPLYYTELGQHSHSSSAATQQPETSAPILHPETGRPDKYLHRHGLSNVQASGVGSDHDHTVLDMTFEGAHSYESDKRFSVVHPIQVGIPVYGNILPVLSTGDRWDSHTPFTAKISGATSHSHTLSGEMEQVQVTDDHTHSVPLLSIVGSGVSDVVARTGKPALGFVYDLQIAIDGANFTPAIQQQILRTAPSDQTPFWTLIGNGNGGHPLVDPSKDAIPIRIDYLPGVVLGEGEHSIECSLNLRPNGDANGGRIHYNLYVE
jgi:hypothetical protein